MTAFDDIFSPVALEEEYVKLRLSHLDVIRDLPRIARGSDRVDLELFDADATKHIRAASRKAIQGRYTFAPFLEAEIPKDTNSIRTISISTIRDSIVQRALYGYLYDFVDEKLDNDVFGYRRGRNAHAAVKRIQALFSEGRLQVFDADISSFFDKVDHRILMQKVAELKIDERAKILIRRFISSNRILTVDAKETNALKGKQQRYPRTKRDFGVPQGGVLSGLLTNLYLADFDRMIQKTFGGLVRYADDFIICVTELNCAEVRTVVEKELAEIGLKLNDEKTCREFIEAPLGVEFLGFEVSTTSVRVRQRNIVRFKKRILEVIGTQKLLRTSDQTLRTLCRRLTYKIEGPGPEIMNKLIEHDLANHAYHRSWIGFFRIVSDENQIKGLDRWIASAVSQFMWSNYRMKINRTKMRVAGLRSLYGTKWKALRPSPKRSVEM